MEKMKWIPVKTRPTTDEEKEIYGALALWIYDCVLPDHDQEVLITTLSGYVTVTQYDSEFYMFENYEDIDDVIAWMPLPEPYKKKKKGGVS